MVGDGEANATAALDVIRDIDPFWLTDAKWNRQLLGFKVPQRVRDSFRRLRKLLKLAEYSFDLIVILSSVKYHGRSTKSCHKVETAVKSYLKRVKHDLSLSFGIGNPSFLI